MRKIVIGTTLLAASLAVWSGPAQAAAAENWKASACQADISAFGSGVPFIVERVRPKAGSAASGGVVVELGSPKDSVPGKDGWSRKVGGIAIALNGIPQPQLAKQIAYAGWIAFKRKGDNELWQQVFVDEGGSCGRLGLEFMQNVEAPASVLTFFGSSEAMRKQARTSNLVPTASCQAIAARMGQYRSFPLYSAEGSNGPYFVADGLRQTLLDDVAIDTRRKWAAAAFAKKAWATYAVRNAETGEQVEARYLFDTGQGCEVGPLSPTRVALGSVPDAIVREFLQTYAQIQTGDSVEIRQRLIAAMAPPSPDGGQEGASSGNTALQPQSESLDLSVDGDEALHQMEEEDAQAPRMLGGEELAAEIKSFPAPILKQLVAFQTACKRLGGEDASIDSAFVTRIDVDGDNRPDFVMNGDHVFCVEKDGGQRIIGGGNRATNVMIVLSTPRGPMQAAMVMAASGAIFKHAEGYGVLVVATDSNPPSFTLFRNGRPQTISANPKGGEVIYRISR